MWVPRPPASSSRAHFSPARPFGPLGDPSYPHSVPSPAGSGVTSLGDLPRVSAEVKFEAASSKASSVGHHSPVTPAVPSLPEVTSVKVEVPVDSGVAPFEELPPDFPGNDVSSVEAGSGPDTDYTLTAPGKGVSGGEYFAPGTGHPPGNFFGSSTSSF